MNIKELKNKWEREKDAYKTQEVGSGVQTFVKDILLSEDLFNLKQGFKSTPLVKRKKEFLEEEKTKAQRKADIVIYISSDIVIPVEIEKYNNIDAGIKQLITYQADLDKKYGILTDGYIWRFYSNNIFREFNLNQILDETEPFLEYWEEYIKPEFYYLSYFEPLGQLSLLKEEKLTVEQNRELFFKDITNLIRGFKNKLQIEGYFSEADKKIREKRAVEITYAYIIQFILYKTLVDNNFDKFKKEYESIVKTIHKCLQEGKYKEILDIIDGISAHISQNIYRPFAEEQGYIREKLLKIYQGIENNLSDVSPWLDIFVFIKKYDFGNIQYEIFGYIYENYLKELYEDEKKGQYFTDPAVVDFMLKQVGYTSLEIKDRYEAGGDSISLIDPACGSGTFLYSAVDKIIKAFGDHTLEKSKQIEEIVNNNIFGLDIAEFPLYLAEMNILMRMSPMIITEKYNNPIDKKIKVFLTKDSIAEFMDTSLKNTLSDIDVAYDKDKEGQMTLFADEINLGFKSFVRGNSDLEEMKKILEKTTEIPRRRFDYVIANPPYIGYNECSKQKVLIFEMMKEGKAKLNNIYGVNLHSIPDAQKKYAPKPNLYAFFIALGIALLKDNGKLCYIIPQTILTAGDLDVLRYHLAKYTTIEKIITFSGKMFIGRGLKQNKPVATSSLIFILNRKKPSDLHKVEIINYLDPDDTIEDTLQNILIGKKVDKKEILQRKLLQNVVNWNFIKQNKRSIDLYEEYKRNTEDLSSYYEHILAEKKYKCRFYFDKGLVFSKTSIKETVSDKSTDYFDLIRLDNSRYSVNTIGQIVARKDIRIPHGSQGLEVFLKRYKIIWSYMNYDHFYFSDKNIMVNFNYVIISSDNRKEILYLLSLLNSPVIQSVIENNLRTETEKDILVGIKAIKEFVRVPKITNANMNIKEEIIKRTEELLTMEQERLSDYADLSKIILQKFDKVSVSGNTLCLLKDNKIIKLRITKNASLIRDAINEKYSDDKLSLNQQPILLSELKEMPIIDYKYQQELKNYIDDLIFALYFNIKLDKLGLNQAKKIKAEYSRSPYYKLLSTHKQ